MLIRRSRFAFAASASGIVAILAAVHCGGDAANSQFVDRGDPCQTVFKDKCGSPCAGDAECPSGLYCGYGNRCLADCAPGEICRDVTCSPRGRCGSDDSVTFGGEAGIEGGGDATLDNICADTNVELTKLVPKVLFLLDQSSSMQFNKFPSGSSNNCNPDCRWSVLKDVLIGATPAAGGVVKQLQGEAELGVQLYSATDPNVGDGDDSMLPPPPATDAVCPRFNGKTFAGLSIALNNAAAIDTLLRPAIVDDDTPTGPALRAVAGLAADGTVSDPTGFAALPSAAPKVIVLVTDGEPMLCGESNPTEPGKTAVVLAAQHAFAQKIRTFVIAIGAPQAAAHFKAVANAGQGKDPDTGDAVAIEPSTPQQLVDALTQIVLDARTCSFTLNGQVRAGSEKLGTVTLNGAPVPYDDPGAPDEGWHLKDPSTLELVGEACKTLKATPNATLSARFPCGTVLPTTK